MAFNALWEVIPEDGDPIEIMALTAFCVFARERKSDAWAERWRKTSPRTRTEFREEMREVQKALNAAGFKIVRNR